eukprot:CAMPEP_0203803456 /NCGR_PEP_ID=MMETSP0100_2-20121128/12850_1 /ASSEMBLY_ACC=CAM_ASM_000210 /TAXON_ID=96639 /ORGANISM=" , Strain NY0313808BC1" /LENGTH=285 /DNA_ID=CAMNT_0050711187 /DNA_START=185 /DNA_END=1042 /DNA_ORIENTATION=-
MKQSSKVNAMWKEGCGLSLNNPGAQYFELKVDAGKGVWFGLADEDHFGEGWKSSGLMYGGNLSDGGGLKRSNFGGWPKAGDVIGMRAEIVQGSTLRVDFSLNGEGLGTGFEITPLQSAHLLPLYPVVSFHDPPAEATICRKSAPAPESMERPGTVEATSIDGQWSIAAKSIDPTLERDVDDVVFAVEPSMQDITLSAQVANSMRVTLNRMSPHTVMGRECIMTMMMPPPFLQGLEEKVCEILKSTKDLKLGTNELVLEYGDGTLRLEPHQKTFKPVQLDEVDWVK